MFEKKPVIRQRWWTGRRRGVERVLGLSRGALGVSLTALLLIFSAGTVSARIEPEELEDVIAFMNLGGFAGQPTLVVEGGYQQVPLDRHGAVPVVGSTSATEFYSERLRFEAAVALSVQELLPVLCPDWPRDPACRDIPSISDKDRACCREGGVSINIDCEEVTKPADHPWLESFLVAGDPEEYRCRLSSPGTSCRETRVVGWHDQYYYDENCTQEILDSHVEVAGHRCAL